MAKRTSEARSYSILFALLGFVAMAAITAIACQVPHGDKQGNQVAEVPDAGPGPEAAQASDAVPAPEASHAPNAAHAAEAAHAPEAARPPVSVSTAVAAVKTLHETVGASGYIEPSMPVFLTAKVVSRVVSVPVDLGVVVKPGALLVALDSHLYEAKLAAEKAVYEHAHNQLGRMISLEKMNYASAVQVEEARVADANAKDALINAQINLTNTKILSPAPAVVLQRSINPGEMTKIDQELILLGIIDPIMMVAQVSENKIGSVYLGMQAEVGTDAFPGVMFTGTVAKIDSKVNDATRTFAVYIRLANHDLRLKKGVTGYSRIAAARTVLAVPSIALMNPVGERATVFVVDKAGKARMREIRYGAMVEGMAEVLSGVEEGEQVVTAGQSGLRDNDDVQVKNVSTGSQS
ncbi:MAG: efflux RND transporter periplasmic adaptor subunit [Candidatus Binataceae bacterium]|jgi:membrane fusion protein (multidrug efflux system)